MINHTIPICMELHTTKMGERGQIVIPQECRERLQMKKGEKFLIVETDGKLVLQQVKKLKAKTLERLHEDLVDMKIAERRIKELEQGKKIVQTKEKFLKELDTWAHEE